MRKQHDLLQLMAMSKLLSSRSQSLRVYSSENEVVEKGDFRFIRSLSSEHFTRMATRQLSDDTTVNDLGHISRSLDCFTSNFSKTVCDTAKVTIDYYHTLAFDWCHF